MSETAKWRHLAIPFCVGRGLDIGYGGDPVVEGVETFDRELSHPSHAHVGNAKQDHTGDAQDLSRFSDESFDYVYSSHCIEDFENTAGVLQEWVRVLKPGGYLILLFPDEQKFREHCQATGQPRNLDHQHETMGVPFMTPKLPSSMQICVAAELFNLPQGQSDYNCIIIAQKILGG